MSPNRSDIPRIIRFEQFEEASRQTASPQAERIEHLRDDMHRAQQRYSDATRAFAPEYYGQVAAPSGPSHSAAVIQPQPQDELTDHSYDGIQEYDNPTPGWWYAIFAGSAVFSLLYVMVFHTLVPSLPERHAAAEAASLDAQFAELNQLPMGEDKILAIMAEPAWLSQGEAIYQGTCALCHSADGSGLVGPNLTDDKYKNITGLVSIADLITTGTTNGAMPSQKNILNENEIALVAAYAASLRGRDLPTNPTVSPDYEGVPIDPWPTPGGAE